MPHWYGSTDNASDASGVRYDPPEPTTAWVTTTMPDTRVEVQGFEVSEDCIATDDHIVYYSMDDCGFVSAEITKPHRTVKQLLEEADWEL